MIRTDRLGAPCLGTGNQNPDSEWNRDPGKRNPMEPPYADKPHHVGRIYPFRDHRTVAVGSTKIPPRFDERFQPYAFSAATG